MTEGNRYFIKMIELSGFKSYKETQIIDLDPNINVISGPNGSGKSNILDALCFVFGHDSRLLRSSNYKSLISRGCNKGYVSLYLFPIDDICQSAQNYQSSQNAIGTHNIQISNISCPIKKFTGYVIQRSISEIGNSIYKIAYDVKLNHYDKEELHYHSIRKRDVLKFFKEINIDLNFPERFIILQQNASQIAKMTPIELMDHLEILFNTISYKNQIIELESKATLDLENLDAVNQNIEENNNQMALLTPEIEKLNLIDNLNIQLNENKEEYNQVLSQLVMKEYSEIENNISSINKEIKSIQLNLDKENIAIEKTRNKLNEIENNKKDLEKKIIKFQSRRNKVLESLESSSSKFDLLNQKKLKSQNQITEKLQFILNSKERIEGCIVDIKENNKKKNDLELELNHIISNILENNNFSTNIEDFIYYFEIKNLIQINYKEYDRIFFKIVSDKNILNEIEVSISKIELEVEEVRNKLNSIDKEEKYVTKLISKKKEEVQFIKMKNSNMYNQKLRNIRLLVKELNLEINGIKGILIDLLIIKPGFENTIISALGFSIFDIVVDSYQVAIKAIEYAKKKKYKIQCLVLNSEIGNSIINNFSNCIPLIELVSTEHNQLLNLLKFKLRKWYYCKDNTISESISWNSRVNIITDSSIFYANGDISIINKSKNNLISNEIGRLDLENYYKEIENLNNQLNYILKTKSKKQYKKKELEKSIIENKKIKEKTILNIEDDNEKFLNIKSKIKDLEEIINFSKYKIYSDFEINLEDNNLIEVKNLIQEIKLCEINLKTRIQILETDKLRKKNAEDFIILEKDKINKLELEINELNNIISDNNSNLQSLDNEIKIIQELINQINSSRKTKKNKLSKYLKKTNLLNIEKKELDDKLNKLIIKKKNIITENLINESLISNYSKIQLQELEKKLRDIIEDLSSKIQYLNLKVKLESKNIYMEYQKSQSKMENLRNEYKCNLDYIYKQISELQDKRYRKFSDFCQKVNRQFSDIMHKLTLNMNSDCYLQFIEKNEECFKSGISILSKHEGGEWKTMALLSGGQQATVSCALSITLQKLFPCPFLICDEIDASLDIHRTEHLSKVLRELKDRQIIIVSLRPQIYDYSGTIIGVYSFNQFSKIISLSEVEMESINHNTKIYN